MLLVNSSKLVMSQKDVSKKKSKTQKVIVPKGTIDPSDTTVIEIPEALYGQPIVIAKRQDLEKCSNKSVKIDEDENEIIRRLSSPLNTKNACCKTTISSEAPGPSTCKSGQKLNLDETEIQEKELILKQLEEFHNARRKFLMSTSNLATNSSMSGVCQQEANLLMPTMTKSEPRNPPVGMQPKSTKPSSDSMGRTRDLNNREVIEQFAVPRYIAKQESERPPSVQTTFPSDSATATKPKKFVTTAVGTSDEKIRPDRLRGTGSDANCPCPMPPKQSTEPTKLPKSSTRTGDNTSSKSRDFREVANRMMSMGSNPSVCCGLSNPRASSTRTTDRVGGNSCSSIYSNPMKIEALDDSSSDSCTICCSNKSSSNRPDFRAQSNKCDQDLENIRRQLQESRRTLDKVVAQVYKTMSNNNNSNECLGIKSKKSEPTCESKRGYDLNGLRDVEYSDFSEIRKPTGSGCRPVSSNPRKSEINSCCSKSGMAEKKSSTNKKYSNLLSQSSVCPSGELVRSAAEDLKNTLRKLSMDASAVPSYNNTDKPVKESSCTLLGLQISPKSSNGSATTITPQACSSEYYESTRITDDDVKMPPQLKPSLKQLDKSGEPKLKCCKDSSSDTGTSSSHKEPTTTSYHVIVEQNSPSTCDASTNMGTDFINIWKFTYKQ